MMAGKWLAACGLAMAAAATMAGAAQYPERPIRMVIPFPPGGSLDVVGRIVGYKLTEVLGQNILIDNRSGASGNIGVEIVVRAPADGYTILLNTLPLAVNPSLFAKLPFDVMRDLTPISLVAASPFVLVVHPSLPVKSTKELIALARARPGQINYASAGNGTNLHVAAERFKSLAKVDMTHVPYKGGGPALTAVLAGEAQVGFISSVAAMPHVASGRLRALGITSAKRSPALPQLVSVAESGLPGYEFTTWFAILGPRGLPEPVVTTLHKGLLTALKSPDVRERLSKEGAEVIGSSPAELGTFLQSEIAKWAEVVKAAGLKAD
jgi:tripartite-type tricarboxylate transporter receptor subunit TctC